MNKFVLLPAMALAIAGGSMFASSQAFAQSDGTYPLLVQRIADKFQLNPDDVLHVVEEVKDERQQLRMESMEERLTQAVSEGKLSEAQKQAVLEKHAQLRTQHEEMLNKWKEMSEEERRNTMNQHHEDLRQWAKENGIDLKYVIGPMFLRKIHKNELGADKRFEVEMMEAHSYESTPT